MTSARPSMVLAFLLGAFSLAAQTLLFREHLLAYAGSEVGVAVFLASWLLWIGLGAWLGRLTPRCAEVRTFPLVLSLYPVALVVQLFLLWHLRTLAGVGPSSPFPLGLLVAWTAAVCAPLSLATGALFTWLAIRSTEAGRSSEHIVARLYGLEALGSGLGGAAVTALLWLGAGIPVLVLVLVVLWLVVGAWYGWRVRRTGAAAAYGIAALAVLAGTLGPLPESLEEARRNALPIPEVMPVLATADTPYQHVSVARFGSVTALFANGELATVWPDESGELQAATLRAMHPGARAVRVVGLGALPLVCALADDPEMEVHFGGLDGSWVELLAGHAEPGLEACLARPNVRQEAGDERVSVARSPDGFYDVVVLATGEPRSAHQARFYSVEFFREVRRVLRSDGLFSLSITTTENVLRGAALSYSATVWGTLGEVFPHRVLTAGEETTFFAGGKEATLTGDGGELAQRLEAAAIPGVDWVLAGRVAARFDLPRMAARIAALAGARESAHDGDAGMVLDHLLALDGDDSVWQFWQAARVRVVPLVLLLLGAWLAGLLLLGGRARGFGSATQWQLLAGGLGSMAAQVAILLAWQVRFGSLLAEFGALNAAAMVGLFVGSRWGAGRRWSQAYPVVLLAALLGVAALVGPALAALSAWPLRVLLGAAPMVVGVAAGGCLALAEGELRGEGLGIAQVAARVSFLDHAGGVAGALVAGLLLVPAAGLATSVAGSAALAVVPLVLRMAGRLGWGTGSPGVRMMPAQPVRQLLVALLLVALGWRLLPALPEEAIAAAAGPMASAPVAGGLQASGELCGPTAGWGGPLEVRIGLDEEGRVTALQLGRHHETPAYLYGVDRWLADFVGKRAEEVQYGGSGEYGVAAFTGATVTGKAVVEAVRCVGRGGVEAVTSEEESEAGSHWLAALVAVVLGLGLGVGLRDRRRLQTVTLVLVAGVCGAWLNVQLSGPSVLAAAVGPAPPWMNLAFWLPCAAALVGGLLAGPLYCGTLCPAGAVQELLSRLPWKLAPTAGLDRALRQVKYVLACLLLVTLLAGGGGWGAATDPLAVAFRPLLRGAAWGLVVVLGVMAVLWHRPWCRYLCPLGAVLSVGERFSWQPRWLPGRRYGRCHVGVAGPEDWDCLRCHRCVAPRPAVRPGRSLRGTTWALAGVVLACAGIMAASLVARESGESVRTPPGAVGERGDGEAVGVPRERPAALPQEEGESPRLYRHDNKAYEHQRTLSTGALRRLLREGRLADHEALHWVSVPPP